MENKQLFIVELDALLKKYNASIEWHCGDYSDLHGVYDERMVLCIDDKTIIEVNGSYVDKHSFK